jgi:threonine dehydrogenase-like Zn-dependent dehydrogenase
LILGHESLGRVLDPGPSGFAVGVLLEPTTVVAKAWEHIASIGRRSFWDPSTVLVIGVGTIGLLAALIGVQYGGDVHVLDRATSGPKPALTEALGAAYHAGAVSELGLSPDVVVECTGVAPLIRDAAESAAPGGIVCLTGVGPPITPEGRLTSLASDGVLKNLVLFGSVNANRRQYYRAAQVLARADRSWLERLVTRRVGADGFDPALERDPGDIKVVIEFAQP